MMRIAIAGAGTLAGMFAYHLSQTSNPVLVLSRTARPDFEEQYDCQVAEVDYDSVEILQFVLRGVDLVISTFRGREQINLIHAARRAGVRHFVPGEFEGALANRPGPDDPLDDGSAEAIEILKHYANSGERPMRWTAFTCGILYEQFSPGGLGFYGMGGAMNIREQGDYLVDVGCRTADIVETNARGRTVSICMTALDDVARFVAAAVELGTGSWPREFQMRGDRMSVRDVLAACNNVRGGAFSLRIRRYADLDQHQAQYHATRDWPQWRYIRRLRATADGRYDFRHANLNDAVNSSSDAIDVEPISFRAWLEMHWTPE